MLLIIFFLLISSKFNRQPHRGTHSRVPNANNKKIIKKNNKKIYILVSPDTAIPPERKEDAHHILRAVSLNNKRLMKAVSFIDFVFYMRIKCIDMIMLFNFVTINNINRISELS